MSNGGDQKRLAAILAADMVGYTQRMEQDTDGTVAAWKAARSEIIDPTISGHAGHIVKHTGDGFLAEFPTVQAAVECAVAMQDRLATSRLDFRMGVNLGDIIDDGEDIHGEGVNIAARIEALAEPGGICISGSVHEQVRNRLMQSFADMGEVEVKNVSDPVRVFRVLFDCQMIKAPRRSALAGKLPALAAAIVLVVIAAGGSWWWQSRMLDTTPVDPARMAYKLPEKPSLAVLPFDNWSGDPSQTHLGDSMTENIIAVLSTSPDLSIISRNSTFTFKGKATKVQEVAEQLGVRYVLEGSVQKSGDSLRVTAQLVDAVDGKHLWAERYDRDVNDFFTIQDEITEKILVAMHVTLTAGASARQAWNSLQDLETMLLYLQIEPLFQKRTVDGNSEAGRIIRLALDRQPLNAGLIASLGHVYLQRVQIEISNNQKRDLAFARAQAKKAIALNDLSDSGHGLLASIELQERNYVEAIRNADRALRLGPTSGRNVILAGMVKTLSGQPLEGAALLQRGMRLEPYHANWVPGFLVLNYMILGQFEEAKTINDSLLNAHTKDPLVRPNALVKSAAISVFAGNLEEARESIDELIRINPGANLIDAKLPIAAIKDQAFLTRYLNALLQAGLPKNPAPATVRISKDLGNSADSNKELVSVKATKPAMKTPLSKGTSAKEGESVVKKTLGGTQIVQKLDGKANNDDSGKIGALITLGHQYLDDGKLELALRSLGDAYKLLGGFNNPSSAGKAVAETMSTIFERLFLNRDADFMDATQALMLFYEFRQFTPLGSDGDRAIQYLAEILVKAKKYNRAAQLLNHQMLYRLRGEELARISMRLVKNLLHDARTCQIARGSQAHGGRDGLAVRASFRTSTAHGSRT
ncbi:MAG: adenylate/guanylate cyclase domain-containing protein [Alphaproteobacteria bacterium]|jgi:adenylate cyclase|nr:adenylate/guanylate cyclase domain-containing protein [Alphaproteobacteria bacterium]MDP6623412.1 adenylate/guanylate cyclase domain-containing protein [Alphaproteobacteria bacterium]